MEKIKGTVQTITTPKENQNEDDPIEYESKVVAEIGDKHKFKIVAKKLKVMARS